MEASRVSIIVLAAVAVLALIIGIISVKMYKKKVNRALSEETSRAHIGIPAPAESIDMIIKVVILIVLILIFVKLRHFGELDQKMDNLESNQTNLMMSVSSLNSSIADLKDAWQKGNSRVLSYSLSYGDLNASDNTCKLMHSLVLKNYSDDTSVSIKTSKGEVFKMTEKATGTYEFEQTADIFTEGPEDIYAVITDGSESCTEVLRPDEYIYPEYWNKYIPVFLLNADDYMHDEGNIHIGWLHLMLTEKSDYRITSASLLASVNGKVVEKIDVTDSFKGDLRARWDVSLDMNKDYQVTEKDTFMFSLKYETEDGYTVEQPLLERIIQTDNGGGIMVIEHGNTISITDKTGRLVKQIGRYQ